MQTINETIKKLHEALTEYIEATYHISAPSLIAQRQELLAKPGVIHQVPYLESTPRYETGKSFADMTDLPAAALQVFESLAKPNGDLPRLLYDPPYRHQSEAIDGSLIHRKNLVVMTGTGSGKTESFLLPILGKLATEAKGNPRAFGEHAAMRALILYPMNALVNDQLGRLRALFADPRLVRLFKQWSGRPPRFARYTSRTPYAGIRTSDKDSQKLSGFESFYVSLQRRAEEGDPDEKEEAKQLLRDLKSRGKWPAKPDLAAWFGQKGTRWQDGKTSRFTRAITLPDDSELLTRHEVQASPPDLLVTNYSMLEYMLMRPIERSIFDSAREWLEKNPRETFLIVLDEAHLYRGAAGAEVGLLLRRLRDRLNVPPDRFQVICATASFKDARYAPDFGAQLSGVPAETFIPIVGNLDWRAHSAAGSTHDAEVLANIDLAKYYAATSDSGRIEIIRPLLQYRGVKADASPDVSLYEALAEFSPMGLLINSTMKQARPVAKLGTDIFPTTAADTADAAVTVLMALGSIARPDAKSPGLLPCRIHNFFRGLPGLWVCMDPKCSELPSHARDGICGKMYSQPREFCDCNARVLEFYTCRNCGSAYARAYTDDLDTPTALWSKPGRRLRLADHEASPLLPIDLLLEQPTDDSTAELADFDLESATLNPAKVGSRMRSVYLRSNRVIAAQTDDDEQSEDAAPSEVRGLFTPCGVCGKMASFGRSYVQDHQTKGDEPFQALVSRQIQIQPPAPMEATPFAPLQGRKVLTFSDSRQVAARLAPNLQNYSVRDSLRPLILYGCKRLQSHPSLLANLNLEDLYLAVLLASQELGVRLRPELKGGESFDAESVVAAAVKDGTVKTSTGLQTLCMDLRTERPPEALLENIVKTIRDRFLGLEALALASIVERSKHTAALERLPSIPGVIDTPEAKVGLARAWLRCWRSYGFWLNSMPLVWASRPSSDGQNVRARKGKIKAMEKILLDKGARQIFDKDWTPQLLKLFTQDVESGYKRLRGSELSLSLEGAWVRCVSCKSVHRPVVGIAHCLDCSSSNVIALDPDTDRVFVARKGYYRKPAVAALSSTPTKPMALIAAEHTAQLNAPQSEDIFSKAEENELLFQDVRLVWGPRGIRATAIDVLSSTTTMEVGIDLGALSGVALRNMPPARANYQQRAGRAGRRGNAIATVLAFGSADTHDEHYFSEPDGMICGDVVDPRLTLDNPDIVRRHIRAFLLQCYHQDRLPQVDDAQRHDLFSVLGTVSEFRTGKGLLNRDDFASWLDENETEMQRRCAAWIPKELSSSDRDELLLTMKADCLSAIDDAIRPSAAEAGEIQETSEEVPETDEEGSKPTENIGTLLDRLLYCGKLPRYAFPTDVATFHVFDPDRSSYFHPVMRFAPSQGLPIALSQYAPGKQVWIAGKCYTSGAIYSVMSDDRFNAWEAKRRYLECRRCGFAETLPVNEVDPGEIRDCKACGAERTFGPARNWMRPPGFAHPIDLEVVTSPDEIPETSYATRAKLTMSTPSNDGGWIAVNDRIRVLSLRQHLLVSNTGPKKEGYLYCTKCGRIEASTDPDKKLLGPHQKPFPERDSKKACDGNGLTQHLVLGTDFITDIVLFSTRVESPMRLRPGHYSTDVALRTASEALAKAAAKLLEIEPGELMAEFRPALTTAGTAGLEAEIFLYDTLPGGAGFASQLAGRGDELFRLALKLMKTCPEDCDASCYRCLRSFKNKFEHSLLDRHVGAELLEYLVAGDLPQFDGRRLAKSTELLANDIRRNGVDLQVEQGAEISISRAGRFAAPIKITRPDGACFVVVVSGPLEIDHPADPLVRALEGSASNVEVVAINELAIRGNLPDATSEVLGRVQA